MPHRPLIGPEPRNLRCIRSEIRCDATNSPPVKLSQPRIAAIEVQL
ncbi:hypothetical protein BvCmsHHNP029_00442 [Escherichia coli]|nr:hypothetical protein BvCmsHHNP029_00442 [Escherichia coli]